MPSRRVKRQPDALFRPPLDAWWMEELRRFSVWIGGAKEQIDSVRLFACTPSNACPHYPPWSHAAHALHPAPRTPPTPQLDSGNPLTRTRREPCGECEVFVVRYLAQPVPAAGIAACRAQPHQRIPISVVYTQNCGYRRVCKCVENASKTLFAPRAPAITLRSVQYKFFVFVVAGDVKSALMAVRQMWKEASTRRDTNAVQSRPLSIVCGATSAKLDIVYG
ncbi:hypothetical protein C8R44DRAFT_851566 [Mycena epipterygia]|nr:hypothetical protein C8R44DRAFT_851566 [Mycena epipterygia]